MQNVIREHSKTPDTDNDIKQSELIKYRNPSKKLTPEKKSSLQNV